MKVLVNLSLLIVQILLTSQHIIGQEDSPKIRTMGFQLNQYHRDFGIGLNYAGKNFGKSNVSLRLKANLLNLEHIENNSTIWTPYSNTSIGFKITEKRLSNHVEVYTEGGFLTIFPQLNFSSQHIVLGGYGIFGIEYFFDKRNSYFLELGGVGTGATADKLMNKPIYSNGFLIHVGYNFHW
jgi:hypothetical protein